MPGKSWNDNEQAELIRLFMAGKSTELIAKSIKRTHSAVASKIKELRTINALGVRPVVSQSPARVFDDQITAQGDMLILSDIHAPYHDSDWINRCIDLALALKINQLAIAGDLVNFSNFSAWGGNFEMQPVALVDDPKTMAFMNKLPEILRQEFIEIEEKRQPIDPDNTITTEMKTVRKLVSEIGGAFSTIFYTMGNHDNWKNRFQGFNESVAELGKFLEIGDNWKLSPYYYMFIDGKIKSRIEHPYGSGPQEAIKIAVQEHMHVFMGHSHMLARNLDPSSTYWCIQMGHCVDEKKRLQYVAQRTMKRNAHALGALLWYDGYPWLLEQETPFERMKKMA